MIVDSNKRQVLYRLATAALLVAIAALWVPTAWKNVNNQRAEWAGESASVTYVELGVLQPLELTWESSPNGFWLSFSAMRLFSMFLSVTLTIAAVLVARQTRLAMVTS